MTETSHQRKKGNKGKSKGKGFGKKGKMNEVGFENDMMEQTCGGRTMVLGGRTSLG